MRSPGYICGHYWGVEGDGMVEGVRLWRIKNLASAIFEAAVGLFERGAGWSRCVKGSRLRRISDLVKALTPLTTVLELGRSPKVACATNYEIV